MDLKDEFYEDELSWYCELYEFWTNDSCYLYDHPFGSILSLSNDGNYATEG